MGEQRTKRKQTKKIQVWINRKREKHSLFFIFPVSPETSRSQCQKSVGIKVGLENLLVYSFNFLTEGMYKMITFAFSSIMYYYSYQTTFKK